MAYLNIKPLPEGYKPCLQCKNNGKTAFSEEVTYVLLEDLAYPEYYAFSHWCDPGYNTNDWLDAETVKLCERMRTYTQGHSGLRGNIYIPGVPGNTKEEIRDKWNKMNTPIIGLPRRWYQWLYNKTVDWNLQ